MSRVDPQVNLRMPAALKRRLEAAAKASDRSLTQEINRRLEQSFDTEQKPVSREEIVALIDAAVDERIRHLTRPVGRSR